MAYTVNHQTNPESFVGWYWVNLGGLYHDSLKKIKQQIRCYVTKVWCFTNKEPHLYLEDHPMSCKWLITMVIVSPLNGVMGPLPNGRILWLINRGDPNHLRVMGWSSKYLKVWNPNPFELHHEDIGWHAQGEYVETHRSSFFQKHRPHFLMLTDSEVMCIQVKPLYLSFTPKFGTKQKMLVKKPEKVVNCKAIIFKFSLLKVCILKAYVPAKYKSAHGPVQPFASGFW